MDTNFQTTFRKPLADKLFGQKDLQVNLDNSVYGSSMQEGNYATLGGSTKLSIEKGALSIFTSRNASLSTGIYTPTVTTTTGAEYNAKTIGANISKTCGQNVDILTIGGRLGKQDALSGSVNYSKDSSMGERVDLGLGYNPENGVNLNAGCSIFNGQKSVNMGIGVNNPNGLSPGFNITNNGDYTSTVRYKMMTLGLSKISQNQGFNFGTSFQF